MEDPDFEAAVETADEADLDELAEAVITWAEQQRAREIAAWSSPETARTAKALERQDLLKALTFYPEDLAAGGDLDADAVLRYIEREVESWRDAEHAAAGRADLREIATTFLRWTQDDGAVSAWEALRF